MRSIGNEFSTIDALGAANPLLARGRDRLEILLIVVSCVAGVPYSLGDALDWKQQLVVQGGFVFLVSYSLGGAIDWKRKRVSCLWIPITLRFPTR